MEPRFLVLESDLLDGVGPSIGPIDTLVDHAIATSSKLFHNLKIRYESRNSCRI
jgi:hypothetical protein